MAMDEKSNKISGLNHQFKIFSTQISFDELNPKSTESRQIQIKRVRIFAYSSILLTRFPVARRRFIDKNHLRSAHNLIVILKSQPKISLNGVKRI